LSSGKRHQAVIIGGGIGGLLAAHALADRFERVTVLERDRYPADASSSAPPSRRGVPQSRCLHLLLAAGAAAFDRLVPQWRDELVALGATAFDASADTASRLSSGWLPRTPSGIRTYACSRGLLEMVLRRALADRPTVRVREGRKVVGLLGDRGGERVTGVRVAARGGTRETKLAADIVVDASGAGSRLLRWMAPLLGDEAAQADQTVVESGRQFVSRWFHLKPADEPDWHCLAIAPSADTGFRSAMMLRAERNRWGVVLLAPAGEPLPSDGADFLRFVVALADGELGKVLGRARPVSPIHRYGSIPSRMMHYDRMAAWPARLVAVGDSVCMFDPYFGLGMTAAARGVLLLANHLDRDGAAALLGLAFQKELAALNAEPWRLATGHDPDGLAAPHDNAQFGRAHAMAPSSAPAAHALLAVQHLLRPAEALKEFTP
jgi:2-polyprenyl-6-methoxyphenol hydroxylase-like FAD-dependent oxidoreductase